MIGPESGDDSTTHVSETSLNSNEISMEKVEPFTTPKPETTTASTLNSTILAEAFQFVGALMRSLGMGDIVDGISTVLPSSTATELLKRMDVGGWVSKYQAKYIAYAREFNLGYCYMEYGIYNVANEGVGNLISRVFGTGRMNRRIRRSRKPGRLNKVVTISDSVDVIRNASEPVMEPSPGTGTSRRVNLVPPPGYVKEKTNAGTGSAGSNRQSTSNQSQGPNLMNMANMLMQVAAGGNGGDGDKVTGLLQNALPLLGQVATSPMVQGVVSNIVANFLTPPDNNKPQQQRPPSQKFSSIGEENNEIEPLPRPPVQQSTNNGRPPPQQQQEDSGLIGMLGQIAQTYVKHYFSSKNPPPRPVTPKPTNNPEKNSIPSTSTQASPLAEEKSDIVETISEVAKPFFISYFGLVPGVPGFGQLNIAERSARLREDILTRDPDASTGITDLIFGTSHLASTGNSLFDFGNRIVYAFSESSITIH